MKIALEITPHLEPLFGTRDENLRLMEDSLDVRIDLRSDAVHVEGAEESVVRVQRIFQDFETLRRQGVNPHNGELNGMLRLVVADPTVTLRSLADSGKQRSVGVRRMVQPRSVNQRKYVEAIEQNDMVFGVGPAGTGKTYLAVAMAVAAIVAKRVSRIVLVRPAVEAGEREPGREIWLLSVEMRAPTSAEAPRGAPKCTAGHAPERGQTPFSVLDRRAQATAGPLTGGVLRGSGLALATKSGIWPRE